MYYKRLIKFLILILLLPLFSCVVKGTLGKNFLLERIEYSGEDTILFEYNSLDKLIAVNSKFGKSNIIYNTDRRPEKIILSYINPIVMISTSDIVDLEHIMEITFTYQKNDTVKVKIEETEHVLEVFDGGSGKNNGYEIRYQEYLLNDRGLVTKIVNEDGFDAFQYDENQNLVKFTAVTFEKGKTNPPYKYYLEMSYEYDNMKNPLHGYLPIYPFGHLGFDFSSSYSKNNVIKVISKDHISGTENIRNIRYEYNNEGYPVKLLIDGISFGKYYYQ